MLNGVPMTPDDPVRQYGAGVRIEARGEFGPVYGHAGWIPGYVSSLRHYPELGATVAFQINTDVGFADGDENPLTELEQQLAQIARNWRLG
jgi:D-alanyl-D-alanine carboxypeptidase